MAEQIVYTTASREQVSAMIRSLPAVLAGRAPDTYGIARGFKLRLAMAVLSTIKQQFILKARGGTDEAGLKWPPLSPKYLAYGRPQIGRNPPRAGGTSPGGKDGFMSPDQEKEWWAIYRKFTAIFAANMPLKEAKGKASAVAWSKAKASGVRTKLEVFGKRTDVEILRDRGTLFNSLSPGILVESGVDASYVAPAGQVVTTDRPGELAIGTTVEYAIHHHGPDGRGRRPLWPRPETWPDRWWEDWLEVASSGLRRVGELLRGAA